MPLPQSIHTVIRRLNDAGFEAYVVGGAVRSWLLGTDIHDYDITTSALPQEVKQVFQGYRTVNTGIRHGTVTVLDHGNPVEVTTYRTETAYTDHRHPDSVAFCRSLREDCARRDFTMNALCYHPEEGIRDFYGGVSDLENHVIRAVGDPNIRFEEDALRILRGVRFAAQLGFQIEAETRAALLEKKDTLSYVSQERITAEFSKTIAAPYAGAVLEEYRSLFVLLIPELQAYSDAQWRERCAVISRCPEDVCLRMAVLLSGLDDLSCSDRILRRMKFSNRDRSTILNYLETKDMPVDSRIDMRRVMNRLTVPVSSFLDFRCAEDPSLDRSAPESLAETIQKDGDCYTLKQLSVSGEDLSAAGLCGEQIAVSLSALLNAVMEEQVPNKKSELMRYLRDLSEPEQ